MTIRKLDPRLDHIVDADAEITVLAEGLASAEGPVWSRAQNCLFFSEVGIAPTPDGFRQVNNGRRYRWSPESGEVALVHEPTNMTNGMTLDREGRLLMCEYGSRRVTRLEHDGTTTVVASHYRGLRLSAPNDIVVKSDGSIYFTDTGGVMPGLDIDFSCVFRVSADLGSTNMVARDFQLVNGLAFSPDEKILYINDSQGLHAHEDTFYSRGTVRAYDVRPGGMLANGRLFCGYPGEESGMPDGMKCDRAGNIYCTGPGGIWVHAPDGTHLGIIETGVEHNLTDCTNLAWGGADWKTLFITTSSTLLKVEMKIAGVPVPARQPGTR